MSVGFLFFFFFLFLKFGLAHSSRNDKGNIK
jgi:hypothetical protein